MLRRSMLKATASFALVGAPRLAKASSPTTLHFVPLGGLVTLDPVAATGRVTGNHGFLVFDALYGLDETFNPQPQMVAGHTIEDDGKRWTLTLRDQLRFHDGEKVRGRDVVASLRRFGARDGMGQSLMAATDELSAPDDQRIVFQLKKPFPHPCPGAGRQGLHHAGATGEHRSLQADHRDGRQRSVPLSGR
jgi:peptide/nickel transport system substrate-binding protein